MPVHGKDIRIVALFLAVILAGFFCLSAWAPDVDAGKGKPDSSTSVSSASGEEDTPGVQEQEQETPAKIAKKRFPWLWVAAGVVVVGVVLYFTVFKKPEYKLTVTLGTGVSGTPVAGTSVYKKGKKIHYLYSLGYGYRDLKVTLDNKAVEVSGEITMDGDHTLSVTAEEQFYDLTVTTSAAVTGTPAAGSYNYKVGTSIAYSYAEASGYNNLKVQVDGIDAPAQGTLLMDKNHALSATAEKIPDVSGVWQLTFTMVKKGTVTTVVATFVKYPPGYSHWWTGGVTFSGYQDPSWPSSPIGFVGGYLLKGREVEIGFNNGVTSFLTFGGTLYDDDNRMSGKCWIGHGDPIAITDTGTWSAYRL